MRDVESIVEWINLADLTIDLRVQQPLREGRVRQILGVGFLAAFAGLIVVSVRDDGTIITLDGQHRVAAALRTGLVRLKAQVYYGLTLEEEAQLFSRLNTKNNPSAISKFKVDAQFDPTAMSIKAILSDFGWSIVEGGGAGSFSAVNKATSIFVESGLFKSSRALGPDTLRSVISTVTQAWGLERKGAAADIIGGLALMFIRYPDLDAKRLVRALKTVTPDRLVAQIKTTKSAIKTQPDIASGYEIHSLYNKSLRVGKLDPFVI